MQKKKTVEKRPRGRPSKRPAQLLDIAKEKYLAGATDLALAKEVGVSRATIFRWGEKDADFWDTRNVSKIEADKLVEQALFLSATGYKVTDKKQVISEKKIEVEVTERTVLPNVQAGIFWLINRQPENWSRTGIKQNGLVAAMSAQTNKQLPQRTFEEFLSIGGYFAPFPKQIEMMNFALLMSTSPRMLLGARGYGKSDYITVAGLAYKIYCDPDYCAMIITKSELRNQAIVKEIARLLKANGFAFEKESSEVLRAAGLVGKEDTLVALTIGSSQIRSRHPDIIVMDDPVTPEDTKAATRRRAKLVYEEVLKLTQNVIVIGQPVHKHDLYGDLKGKVETMLVPHGSIPELDADLEAMSKVISRESIEASYHLRLIDVGENPFDKVKSCAEMPPGQSVAFLDPANGGKDFVGLSCIKGLMQGVAVKGRCWKRAWNHVIDEIVIELRANNVIRLAIETNGVGQVIVDMFRAHPGMKGIGVVAMHSDQNKHQKICNAGVYAEMIHICQQSDEEYINQVTKYELGAQNDDAPDSLASCLRWMGLIR